MRGTAKADRTGSTAGVGVSRPKVPEDDVADVVADVVDAAAEATSARQARRRRRAIRTLGVGLIAYGVIGIVLLAATTVGVAGPLGGLTKLTESVEDQRQGLIRALDTTARTLGNAGLGIGRLEDSLTQASSSTTQAANLSRGVSATMSQLSVAMGIDFFGTKPLIGLQSSFDEAARQLSELGASIDGIGAALAANRSDIRVTEADIEELRVEVQSIARELRTGPRLEVSAGIVDGVRLVLFGVIGWLGLLSLGITALGTVLVARAARR